MDLQITIPTIQMYPDGRMDAANAARYAGLATKTLAMMRCNGTGPRFVKKGRIFYFKEDLDAWLGDDRATSTAQAQQSKTAKPPVEKRKPKPVSKVPTLSTERIREIVQIHQTSMLTPALGA